MIWLMGMLFEKTANLIERVRAKYRLHLFAKSGKNCHIEKWSTFTSSNIYLGDNVYIAQGATFLSADAKIFIGNNVMFGPNVTIVTGNHRTDVIGKYMIDVKEKRPTDDEDVVIEDDVWIGLGSTILKGVTIGRGSVIGAGTMVTDDVEPYSVVYNKREVNVKKRFTEEQIVQHEMLLKQE